MKTLAYLGIAFSTVAMVFSLNSARAMDDSCTTQYCTIYDLHSNIDEMPHVLLAKGSPNIVASILRQCRAQCPARGTKERPACIRQCNAHGPGGHD